MYKVKELFRKANKLILEHSITSHNIYVIQKLTRLSSKTDAHLIAIIALTVTKNKLEQNDEHKALLRARLKDMVNKLERKYSDDKH